MKKRIFIIAALMVAFGLTLALCGAFALNFDFSLLETDPHTDRSVDIVDPFNSISANCGVKILPSESGADYAVFTEEKNITYTLSVENGVLTLTQIDQRAWQDYIGLSITHPQATLYLTQTELTALTVQTHSENINVAEGFHFETAALETTSGNIDFHADVRGELHVQTTSGNLSIGNANAKTITAATTSGNLSISSICAAGSIDLSTSSGKTKLSGVACRRIESACSSGGMEFSALTATERLFVKTSSGSVRLNGCDAGELEIKTSSGSVVGTLLSEKVFIAKTSSGDISVPQTTSGGACKITTSSGDIKITLE